MAHEVVQGTGVRFEIARKVFQSSVPHLAEHAKTVIVDCSDGRFTACDEEFVAKVLGEPYVDELELPGGTATLHTLSSGTYAEVEVMRAKLVFLVKSHNTRRVVLFAHEGCGHYATKYAGRLTAHVRDTQLSDLATVARDLRSRLPKIEIRAFFKRLHDGHVVFDEVMPI